MTVSLSISVDGIEEVRAALDRVNPKRNSAWVGRALLKAGLLTQKISAEEKIKRGGKGPPVPGILTSRTGTLRRSIAVDRSGLPWSIEVGTGLTYGAVHEIGWSGTQRIPSHTRSVAFGRKVAPFRVGAYSRSVSYPPRPFLKPALEKAAQSFGDIFSRELEKEIL